jgi:hypothetical protein
MLAGATVAGGAVAVYALLVRSRCLRWGATGQESGGPLPGDDLIADPGLTATRAITVCAPASGVWPWIAQLGQGRGGFYSYDFLENLAGCDVHSADRIVPEWQDVMAGDQVRLAPQANIAVAYLERGRSLVLRGGIPMGTPRPVTTSRGPSCSKTGQRGQRGCSCAKDMRTRGHGRLLAEPIEAVSFVMSRKMLGGVRDRAEHAAGIPPQSPAPTPRPA